MKDDRNRPAHLFDRAMRGWGESNPAGVAAWLDPSVAGKPAQAFVLRSSALNDPLLKAPVLHSDLVIAIGSERVMHVEYETSPREGLVFRMLAYRARLIRDYPGRRVTQHVIVLGDGRVRGHDDLATNGFALDLNPVHLREHDADEYLSDPFLAPFAALARGSPRVREKSFEAAVRLLRESGHPLAWRWLLSAIALAEVRLDRSTIDRLREKESVMSADPYVERFRGDVWGQALIQEGWEQGQARGWEQGQARGWEQGQAQGWEQGQAHGVEQVLLSLIRNRFGDIPEAQTIARVLSEWETEAAVTAIAAAPDPASLVRLISR